MTDLADALQRQIEAQEENAKKAIREYKKTILHDKVLRGVHQIETRREVEHAVNRYIQLLRRLDELRVKMSAS